MLVLSRKQDETIVIGDGSIQVVVVEVRGNRVRLGIDAHGSIPVYRGEVWAQIQQDVAADLDDIENDDPECDDELVEHARESIDQTNL